MSHVDKGPLKWPQHKTNWMWISIVQKTIGIHSAGSPGMVLSGRVLTIVPETFSFHTPQVEAPCSCAPTSGKAGNELRWDKGIVIHRQDTRAPQEYSPEDTRSATLNKGMNTNASDFVWFYQWKASKPNKNPTSGGQGGSRNGILNGLTGSQECWSFLPLYKPGIWGHYKVGAAAASVSSLRITS